MKIIVVILLISFLFPSQTNTYFLNSDDTFNFLMAEYYVLSKDFNKANQYYSTIKDNINFESSSLYLSMAESNLETGNFNKSLSFFLKSYNLNPNNEDLIVLIYNLYNILGYFDKGESFLINASIDNRENIYLLDILFYHFLNNQNYLEAIEVLADMYRLDNIEHSDIINKSMSIYSTCDNQKLIFDILDSHYITYNNIDFIKIKLIFSHLFDDFDNMSHSYSSLKLNNEVDINNTILFCQKLFLKREFKNIFILLEPYYVNKEISFNGLKLFFNATVELNLKDYFLEIAQYCYINHSDNPLSYDMLINSLIDNKKFNKALEIIEISKNKYPDYYSFNLFEGKLHEMNKNYNKAISIYNSILIKYPDLINIKYNVAKLYNIIGDYSLCDGIFLELLDIDPNNIIFLNDFSFIIANRQSSNKEELNYAIRLIEYGLNIEDNNSKLLDTYGWINYRLGDYNRALEYTNKSLSINRDSTVLNHLIEILKITNKSNKIEEIQSNFLDSK